MAKNNQPIIVTSIIVGAILIIVLALIFTRTDSQPEAVMEGNVVETGEENGENGQRPTPNPAPQPTSTSNPTPDPQFGVLPSNWDSLTVQEKTDLNIFNCDFNTQTVRMDDGQCSYILPTHVDLGSEEECSPADVDPPNCWTTAIHLAIKGEYSADQLRGFWRQYKEQLSFRLVDEPATLVIYKHNGSDALSDYSTVDIIVQYWRERMQWGSSNY